MVFCASLVPCASDTSDAEPICPYRNLRYRCASQATPTHRASVHQPVPMVATSPPINGDSTGRSDHVIGHQALNQIRGRARRPRAIIAPTMPPISACDELDGMPPQPRHQVPHDATDEPGKHPGSRGDQSESTRPFGNGGRHGGGQERADEVHHGRQRYGNLGLDGAPVAIDEAIALAGVVEAVGEVESQRG